MEIKERIDNILDQLSDLGEHYVEVFARTVLEMEKEKKIKYRKQ